jgi:hypothetical protein
MSFRHADCPPGRWRRSKRLHIQSPHRLIRPVCDPSVNPGAVAWFKLPAVELIAKTALYWELLDTRQVAWERFETADPGRVVHEDEVQVIAVPLSDHD